MSNLFFSYFDFLCLLDLNNILYIYIYFFFKTINLSIYLKVTNNIFKKSYYLHVNHLAILHRYVNFNWLNYT